MTRVIAWPPVHPSSAGWTVSSPIASSRSLITGSRYVTASQRRRTVATVSVGGAEGDYGGYMEALKRLLRGGASLVRMRSYAMLHGDLPPAATRQADVLSWRTGSEPLSWRTGSEPLFWLTGAQLFGVISTSSGLPALLISGLPPSALCGRVGEFVTVYPDIVGAAETRMLTQQLISAADGTATAIVDEAFTGSGRVDVGAPETAVFEPVDIPSVTRSAGTNFFYDWTFSQVFADEVGGFEEYDPWG